MKKKIFTLLFVLTVFTMSPFAQDPVRDKIEKAAKDPKAAENAAKADVYLQRQNLKGDSLQKIKTTQPASSSQKKKKKTCKKLSQ